VVIDRNEMLGDKGGRAEIPLPPGREDRCVSKGTDVWQRDHRLVARFEKYLSGQRISSMQALSRRLERRYITPERPLSPSGRAWNRTIIGAFTFYLERSTHSPALERGCRFSRPAAWIQSRNECVYIPQICCTSFVLRLMFVTTIFPYINVSVTTSKWTWCARGT
jgi:hypothetical protein